MASVSKVVETTMFYYVFSVSGTRLGPDVWLVGGSKVVKTMLFYCVFDFSGRVPENGGLNLLDPFGGHGTKMSKYGKNKAKIGPKYGI